MRLVAIVFAAAAAWAALTTSATAHTAAVPQVVAIASGFSQDMNQGAGSQIEFGVTLKNRSTAFDALKLNVTVRAVDSAGRSVATAQIPVTAIPAGGTFVVTGLLLPSVSLSITKVRASATVGQQKPRGLRLPVVTHVHLDTSGVELLNVTGRLTNPYRKPMSENSPIYAVFLNARGRIVGGTSSVTGAQVQPGATVSFALDGILNDLNAKPVSTRVSIDPCSDLDVSFGSCAALAKHP